LDGPAAALLAEYGALLIIRGRRCLRWTGQGEGGDGCRRSWL